MARYATIEVHDAVAECISPASSCGKVTWKNRTWDFNIELAQLYGALGPLRYLAFEGIFEG